MNSIHTLIKPASGNCNLRCKYCFYFDEMAKRETPNYGMMSYNTLENIVEKTISESEHECSFAFQGGEPTLAGLDFFKKFIEFQKKYNKKNIKINNSIQTNAYALNEEWVKFLKKNNFLTGVSLDGTIHTHDKFRRTIDGKDSFKTVINNIKILKKYNVDFNILTVVNSETVKRVRKIYDFYKKNNFSFLQFIQCLDPLYERPGGTIYSLKAEEYGEFLIELFRLWYMDLEKGEAPYIREFDNYVGILLGYPPEACSMKGICSLQNVIEADGSVFPCDFYAIDKYKCGNINENTFSEILDNGIKTGFVQDSLKNMDECEKCEYYFICRGGCRRHRILDENGIPGKNRFCKSYKMFFNKTLPHFKRIATNIRLNNNNLSIDKKVFR